MDGMLQSREASVTGFSIPSIVERVGLRPTVLATHKPAIVSPTLTYFHCSPCFVRGVFNEWLVLLANLEYVILRFWIVITVGPKE